MTLPTVIDVHLRQLYVWKPDLSDPNSRYITVHSLTAQLKEVCSSTHSVLFLMCNPIHNKVKVEQIVYSWELYTVYTFLVYACIQVFFVYWVHSQSSQWTTWLFLLYAVYTFSVYAYYILQVNWLSKV